MRPKPREKIFRVESADDSPGFLLWQVANLWQRQIRAALAPLGLTHVQFVLLASLAWLGDDPGGVTQVRLATHAKTDIMMTSKVLRTLERKGLLRRTLHAADARANAIELTPEGQALSARAVHVVEAADAAYFEVLGAQAPAFGASLLKILTAQAEGRHKR